MMGKNSLSRIFCIRLDTPVEVVCTAQVSPFPMAKMSTHPYKSTRFLEKELKYSTIQGFMPWLRMYSKDRWVGDAMLYLYH